MCNIGNQAMKMLIYKNRRWGTTENSFLALSDKLEKQMYIKKAVKVGL